MVFELTVPPIDRPAANEVTRYPLHNRHDRIPVSSVICELSSTPSKMPVNEYYEYIGLANYVAEIKSSAQMYLLAAAGLTHTSRPGAARGVGYAHSVANCAVISPRKICRAGRNRASLRRELARSRGRNTPAHAASRPPDVVHPHDSARPHGADDCSGPSLPGRPRAPGTLAPAPARPGRPPSRRHSHPRATGTSGPTATLQRDAAPAVVCRVMGTSVRTVGRAPDRTHTNRCTCPLEVVRERH